MQLRAAPLAGFKQNFIEFLISPMIGVGRRRLASACGGAAWSYHQRPRAPRGVGPNARPGLIISLRQLPPGRRQAGGVGSMPMGEKAGGGLK